MRRGIISGGKMGFTLVEAIVAIAMSFMALFGIETLIVASLKDWKTSKAIGDLERDMDLAGYRIKGLLEEADDETPLNAAGTAVQNGGPRIQLSYQNTWKKEFYFDSAGSSLIYKDDKTGSTEAVIGDLTALSFFNGSDGHSVRVDLSVRDDTLDPHDRQLSSSFLVYLRNMGGG